LGLGAVWQVHLKFMVQVNLDFSFEKLKVMRTGCVFGLLARWIRGAVTHLTEVCYRPR